MGVDIWEVCVWAKTALEQYAPPWSSQWHHAMMVANELKNNNNNKSAVNVALLHDVVEDTEATLQEIADGAKLTQEERDALDAITRRPNEQYFKYIERCGKNKLATTVKLVDLRTNIVRCALELPKGSFSLLERYVKAYGMLKKVKIKEIKNVK